MCSIFMTSVRSGIQKILVNSQIDRYKLKMKENKTSVTQVYMKLLWLTPAINREAFHLPFS